MPGLNVNWVQEAFTHRAYCSDCKCKICANGLQSSNVVDDTHVEIKSHVNLDLLV